MNGVGTGTSSFASSSSTINDKWNVEERNRQHRLVRTKWLVIIFEFFVKKRAVKYHVFTALQ